MKAQTSETGYAVFGEDGRLIEANSAILDSAGGDAGTLPIGLDWPDFVARFVAQLTIFDGGPVKSTAVYLRKAGKRLAQSCQAPIEAQTRFGHWKLLTCHPRPGGGTAYISADITALKQAEIAHRQQSEIASGRDHLARAIESLSEGFALYDENGCLVMCNDLYRQMNHEVADLIEPGMPWETLVRASAQRGVYIEAIGNEDAWVEDKLRTGIEFITDYELELPGGQWSSVSVHPTDLGGFVVTRVDITERKRIEAAQREADEIIRRVLDVCPVPIQMSTIEDGRILYRNPAHVDLLGERQRATEYFADPATRREHIAALTREGLLDRYEIELVNAAGQKFPATTSARLFEFQGEKAIVSVVFDETERNAAKDQLRQANDRLIDAIESLAEGFALYGPDDRLVLANSQYRKMHAITADVLKPGVLWLDFLRATAERGQFPVPEDQIDDWLAERTRDRREFRRNEFRHTSGKWYDVTTNPTREGGFVVTRVDVTERKQAEAERMEADALVRQVLEACPVSIQMTRAGDGKIIYRSPAALALLGDADTAIDYYVNPADRERYIERLLRTGSVDDFETDLKRADGRNCRCSVSSRLIRFHGEDVVVSHTYDLTERIAMEEELKQQRETLHQNEKLSALGELLAGVAHELNNPLSIVVGQSMMLSETAADDKTASRAAKIASAAERCSRIVKTFLAMARQQPARTGNVQLNDVIEAAIEVAGYAIRTSEIDLRLDLQDDLPVVWGDPDQLSQVFINLLVNAEQALQDWPGERFIVIKTHRSPETDMSVVEVSDSGPGIAPDIRSRIFEPFFTTKEVGSGTGIGLSFCHRIISSHSGFIHVEGRQGGGTTFAVSVPGSTRREAEDKPDDPDTTSAAGVSVLVVDDEADVGQFIAEVLSSDGYDVAIAGSGRQAIERLASARFDLVLSDLKMPDMDGRELLDRMRRSHPQLAARLGFITGDTVSPGARTFLDQSGRPFLEKPIKPAELRHLVTSILEA